MLLTLRFSIRLLLAASTIFVLLLCVRMNSSAREEFSVRSEQKFIANAFEAIHDGRVQQGLNILYMLIVQASDSKNHAKLFEIGSMVVELLIELGAFSDAEKLLSYLDSRDVLKQSRLSYEWTQYSYARTLFASGNKEAALKIIAALTQHDQRNVYNSLQRGGLMLASRIELESGNIQDAALLIRRSIAFAAHDKNTTRPELLDVLTSYAEFLSATRRPQEALKLQLDLKPLYDRLFHKLGVKRIKFYQSLLFTLNQVGEFSASSDILDGLNEAVQKFDINPFGLREELVFQNIYKGVRSANDIERQSAIRQLITQANLNLEGEASEWSRMAHVYLLVLADELETANRVLDKGFGTNSSSLTEGYRYILRSLIRARQKDTKSAFDLLPAALKKIEHSHNQFEIESNGSLPALMLEERLVLERLLTILLNKAESEDELNSVFQLQQFVVRDKSSIGVDRNFRAGGLRSDLNGQDLKSEFSIKEDINLIMQKIIEGIILHIKEPENHAAVFYDQKLLVTLDEHEAKLRLIRKTKKEDYSRQASAKVVQEALRSREAYIIHSETLDGELNTSCLTSKKIQTNSKKPTSHEARQLSNDAKIVAAAVRATHSPSKELDSSFPVESANRIYKFLFSHLTDCLEGIDYLILGSDPDFFLLPWNALVLEIPEGVDYSHRGVRWFGREFSIALMPNTRAFVNLRNKNSRSDAPKEFLGIGNPVFTATVNSTAPANASPRFISRGSGLAKKIAALSPLPETESEILSIARQFEQNKTDVLIGEQATERSVRRSNLGDYRIISFATHALVAFELEGVSEPAIVLTPGDREDVSKNDGLLTASEISALNLDADLVVLSACNTAAGDIKKGGRGLSGLADAFFSAGARSIAVTQWSVISETAAKMGALIVAEASSNKNRASADGLRIASQKYIDTVEEDYYAHPRFWASYMIAGDVGLPQGVERLSAFEAPLYISPIEFPTKNAEREFMDGFFHDDKGAILLSMYKSSGKTAFDSMLTRANPQGEALESRILEYAGHMLGQGAQGFAVGGYEPGRGAIFSRYDNGLELIWSVREGSADKTLPAAVHYQSGTWTFAAIQYLDWSTRESLLHLVSVADDGKLIRKVELPIKASFDMRDLPSFSSHDGKLYISFTSMRSPPRFEYDKAILRERLCGGDYTTTLIEVDLLSLSIVSTRRDIEISISRLKAFDGSLYFLGSSTECGSSLIHLGRISENSIQSIHEMSLASRLYPSDFMMTPKGWLLVGRVSVYLPFAAGAMRNRKIVDDFLGEDIWDFAQDQARAFAILLNRKDNKEYSIVYADNTYGGFKRVIMTSPLSGIFIGNANGDRAWRKIFNLR